MDVSASVGQKLLLAFHGIEQPSKDIIDALRKYRACGVTLFRPYNINNPEQLLLLNNNLQALANQLDLPPLLIAIDQEGGQLMAFGGGTQLPGNMALGATGSTDLAFAAGEVLGRELSALGVNVNYAPCIDVNINPANPVVGIRSFGENPMAVSNLGAAMIRGIQSQGVAATAKHFPGHGDTSSDSHHSLPMIHHDMEQLSKVELPPFQAAIAAEVKMIMTAHLGLTDIDGVNAPPATLSHNILKKMLRQNIHFEGVIITDAMDMRAIQQGDKLGVDCVKAVNAGADILLMAADPRDHARAYQALMHASSENLITPKELENSTIRIIALKNWLTLHKKVNNLSVIRCQDHENVARSIAEQSITLVRDDAHLLPIHLKPEAKILVITPEPVDLTPADTSSYNKPELAQAIREYHPNVDEIIIPADPDESEIMDVLYQIDRYTLIILCTINALNSAGQARLANEILQKKASVIIVALRLPYDLAAFPQAQTYICTYSILQPSIKALAKALFGQILFRGKLPVSIPGLYSAMDKNY